MRNVRGYMAFVVLTRAFFWYAIFFLYFQSKFTTSQVLLLEAVYYISVVIIEVPSGYFSDKFGRANALRLSALSWTAAYITFFAADEFWLFALAQVMFAAGFAFNSGSDTSFLYGALVEADREEDFPVYEASVGALSSASSAIAAIVGAVLGTYALSYGHLASAITAAMAVVIALFVFREPKHAADREAIEFGQSLRLIFAKIQQPDLAWLFLASVSTVVLIHVPYEYYQPYINELAIVQDGDLAPTIATGIHATAALIAATLFAAGSAWLAKRVGVVVAVLMGLGLTVVMIAAMAWTNAWWVAALLVLRSVPSALIRPIVNSTVVPKLDEQIRATYLSVESLSGRLAFALTLTGLAAIGTRTNEDLSAMLWFAAGLGATLLVVLAIGSKFARLKPTTPQPSESTT